MGFFLGQSRGGGNKGSRPIFRAFSIIEGIILARRGEDNSRQGFVFTSISQTLKFWSIMKSKPKT